MSDVIASCSTCLHKPATGGLDDVTAKCWDCTSFKTLVHWEPRVTERRITVTPRPKELQEAMDKPSEPPKLTVEEYVKTLKGDPEKPSPPKTVEQIEVGIDTHYTKLAIEPMRYSMENQLDPMQHTIVKYVTRFRDKGKLRDLVAARKVIDMLIKYEYGEEA